MLKDGAAVYTPGLSERRGTMSKFYHGDALGSTRGITNGSQTVTDTVLYDGFGMTVSRTGTTPTPFGFVGKGQYQTDNDSGLQLLGHRYYDASVGRFISSDPAKAGDNWYAYCGNRPLSGIDPNGLKIVPPSNPGDRNDYNTALKYLFRDPSYRKMWRDLEKSPRIHHIKINHDGDDRYDPGNGDIGWDPRSALETTDGGRQSPALGLGHEADHAWGDDRGILHRLSNTLTEDNYENEEEKRVITGRESKFADQFGESTRQDHLGNTKPVGSPINRYH